MITLSVRRLNTGILAAIFAAAFLAFSSPSAIAQQPDTDNDASPSHGPAPSRLVSPIDEHILISLKGHVRQDAAQAPDFGPVEDGKQLNLSLFIERTPAQKADLENLIARQQQPGAAEYHKWLTPAEFGARFGASPEDIAKLTEWLESHGFKIRGVLNNASMINFEATAGQVREAFHTQLHYLGFDGAEYPALLQDPQIPAALAPVVAGIHGLNKIPPHANHGAVHQASWDKDTHSWQIVNPTAEDMASPAYTEGAPYYLVGPQDLYTIYKINPVFSGGNYGASATVAVIEESDIEFGTVNSSTGVATGGDVATFRSLFGVPGTLNMHVYHGYGTVTCSAPGIDPKGIGEDFEASLDAEWANATAPSGNLIFMSCDSSPDDGIFSSLEALIDNNLSDVMSMSYGSTELGFSSANYTFLDELYGQAATQGQSILVSSGDSGSDVKDQNTKGTATSGINVSALSASPLVTAAGGTDFQDLYDSYEGGPAESTYWSSTNSTYYGDALSYVPETAWNDSCASSIVAELEGYTGAGYCATNNFTSGDVIGGSGGISTHYAVPSWQTGTSGYSNAMRSQPDIAGFAANGSWGHALLACDSNPNFNKGAAACSSSATFGSGGGTSFVAPYMAGVFGLLRSATGARQGVLNPALYALAKAQYTASATKTACYANGQSSNAGVTTGLPAAACIFNDITTSNNDQPCKSGATSCYVNSGKTYGMLSLAGSSSLTVAYPSAAGFDQVTGLGSINVSNLIADWNTAFTSSTSVSANPTTLSSSQSTELTAIVTGGTPTGYVDTPPAVSGTITFKSGTTLVGSCALSGGTCSASVPASSLQVGANSMTATFGGSGTYPSSTSSSQTVTVSAASTTTTGANKTTTFSAANQSVTLSATVTSGAGTVNEGTVTFTIFSGSTQVGTATTSATLSGGSASVSYTLPGGTAAGSYTIDAVYSGSTDFASSADTAHTLTVTQASQTITFPAISPQYALTSMTLSANASSGLPITYISKSTSICTVSGDNANLIAAGLCTINATQPGNGDYTAATTVGRNFNVMKATQTISFPTVGTQPALSTYSLNATASSGLAVTYSSMSPTICTLSGNEASLLVAGTCTIKASQAGNTLYNSAANVTQSFAVTHLAQTITFSSIEPQYALTSITLSANSTSGLPITFTSKTTSICTVTGSTASLISPGLCTIYASQPGNSDYSAATTVGRNFNVMKATQTITFPTVGTQPALSNYTLKATASSGLTVTYSSMSAICTVSGNSVSLLDAGTCTLKASQAGNTLYNSAANVTQSFAVTHLAQTITFAAIGSQPVNTTVTLSANSTSGLPITFTSKTPTTCTVSGNTASLIATGLCTIYASQAGNGDYSAATTVGRNAMIVQDSQTITFTTIATQQVGTPLTLDASASSGLAISYSSMAPGICTISGNTATFLKAGTCAIKASQVGNSFYQAAAPVTQSFSVN